MPTENRRGAANEQIQEIKGRLSTKKAGSTPALDGGTGVDMVTVRRKSDGVTKTLPADTAAKYLADPAYERVTP